MNISLSRNFKTIPILNKDKVTMRDLSFVWVHLVNYENLQDRENKIQTQWTSNYKEELIDEDFIEYILSQNTLLRDKVERDLKYKTISARYFDWIGEGTYQSHWVERFLSDRTPSPTTPAPAGPYANLVHQNANSMKFLSFTVPLDLIGRNRSIAIFDFWAAEILSENQERISLIQAMQREWELQVKNDSIFSWLNDGDGEKKRALLWSCLSSNGVKGTFAYAPLRSHDDLLRFLFDNKFQLHERKFFNLSARKLWNQQQRRENIKDKKQCNFILSKAADKNLNALAEKYNLTRTEIIELLINSETKRRIYINERLNQKYLLTAPHGK